MEPVVYAEILNRRGGVKRRIRIDHFPFSIGRAYSNDLILEDRHICPQHARLELGEEGRVILRDMGSRNGVHEAASAKQLASLVVGDDESVRIGRTVIRFRHPHHPVGPATLDKRHPPLLRWAATHWSAAALLMLLVMLSQITETYLGTFHKVEWMELLLSPVAAVLVMAVWAGGWALVTRMLIHRPRFIAHWAVTCFAVLAGSLIDQFYIYLRFLVSPIAPIQMAELVTDVTLAGFVLFAHLSLCQTLGLVRRLAAAALVVIATYGGLQMSNFSFGEDWVSVLPYWSRLKPTNPALLPSESADEFFVAARELRDEVDLLVAEAESLDAKAP